MVPLESRQGRDVGKLICEEVEKLCAAARTRRFNIGGIGISVPGIFHASRGTVWAPNIPGWDDYPLRREVSRNLCGEEVRVAIDSDRACYILGETWRGLARGCRDAIFLAVGTGIGAGILVDGRILRGAYDIAGAAGWLALDRPFRKEYIGCGCFEYHASGVGLAKVAAGLAKGGRGTPASLATAKEVFAAYHRGDALARKVVAQAVEFWGMAVANLVSLFNPEKIIFGGGVFGPGKRLLREIHTEARKWAQPISIACVKLEASRLGGDAGLFGAGRLAMQEIEGNPKAERRRPKETRNPKSRAPSR
jgi:glucokinase